MTRTELYNALGRNIGAARIQTGLMLLAKQGRARYQRPVKPTNTGRPGPLAETWFYVPRARP